MTDTVPWPWISEPRSLADALAAVDEPFLQALRELDLPDGHLKTYMALTAKAELNRRSGKAYRWPVLDLPARELTAAQRYLATAGAVLARQRMAWPEEQQDAGDLRLIVLHLFGLEVAKADIAEAQTAEHAPEPVSDPVAVAHLERIEAQGERLEANALVIRAQIDAGVGDILNRSTTLSDEQLTIADAVYKELRRAMRAMKSDLATEIRNGDEERAREVRRWAGKAH